MEFIFNFIKDNISIIAVCIGLFIDIILVIIACLKNRLKPSDWLDNIKSYVLERLPYLLAQVEEKFCLNSGEGSKKKEIVLSIVMDSLSEKYRISKKNQFVKDVVSNMIELFLIAPQKHEKEGGNTIS